MNIELQKINPEDLEMIRLWRNSPDVSMYMYDDSEITPEQQTDWYRRISSDKSCYYWMIYCDKVAVGLAYITDINFLFSSCYWGYYIGDPSKRYGGIGAIVEYKIIEYTFNNLELHKLRCEVFAFNLALIQMHEMFGFRREAYYRQHIKKNNKYEDVVGLAILKSEWMCIRDSIKRKIIR